MDGEVWKPVAGYEQFYHVSNTGRVKMIGRTKKSNFANAQILYMKPKIIKPFTDYKGYIRIGLHDGIKARKFFLHQLVGIAFIPNPENKPQVNHMFGNKKDNRVEVLEWATPSEDGFHKYRIGLCRKRFGSEHWLSKKVYQYSFDGELVKIWGSANEIFRTLGVNRKCVNQKKSNGFHWSYKELTKEEVLKIIS